MDNIERLMTDFRLTKHLSLDSMNKRVNFVKNAATDTTGYMAQISAVSNEGKDWKMVFSLPDAGLYPNEISCTDENNCW